MNISGKKIVILAYPRLRRRRPGSISNKIIEEVNEGLHERHSAA